MQIVDQIRDKIETKGISVLKMSNDVGISAYKIYKWLAGKGNPKHDDVVKLTKWLGNNVEEVPSGEQERGNNGTSFAEPQLATLLSDLMKKQNQLMEMQNKILSEQKEDLIEKVKEIHVNSKATISYLQKILLVDRADHETTMDSLDRIEHQPVGSNATRAGKRELEQEQRLRKKDKKSQDGVDK